MGRAISTVCVIATEGDLDPIFEIDGSVLDSSFDLWAKDDLDQVVLSVKLSQEDLSSTTKFKNCVFSLVEYSRESRRSDAHKFDVVIDGFLTVSRVIKRSEELGTLEFHVVAVRNTGGVLEGISSAAGVVVGQSNPRYVHIDEVPERSGNFLRVKWVDFEKHYPSLRHNSHHVVFDSGMPYLALNSQLSSWRAVMDSKGNQGPRAQMREHAFAVIVTDVWSVLLTRTLSRLSRVIHQRADFDPTVSDQDPTNDLELWEANLLRMWIPRHYMLGADDVWKQKLFEDLKSGGLQQHQLSATIQRFTRLGDEFEKIVQIGFEEFQTT